MRKQMSYNEMSEREMRAYRRKLRRQREQRRRAASVLLALLLMIVCVGSYHSLSSKAKENEEVSLKYYTGVIVKSGDSLWSIADEYIDYDQYKSKQAYVDEVCSINHLYDENEIRAGQRLVVPYYSTEFVR